MPRYIILRDPAALKSRAGARSLEAARPRQPHIEIEDLDVREAAEVASQQGVRAAVRSMPMRLIKPFASTRPATAGTAWGISAVGADVSRFTGAGVTIAVLDTGIDATHPAFAGVDLVQEDFTGSGVGDAVGHGTHCAGTIFGRDVNGDRIGVAPGVTRAFIGKVFADDESGDTDAIVRALTWAAESGANIISMSLGLDFPGMVTRLIEEDGWPVDVATSAALEAYRDNLRLFDSIIDLVKARVPANRTPLVIAASGNESRRNESPDYCIAASLPASAEGVLAVGALADAGGTYRVADFSNTSPNVSAPGVDIKSAWPGGGLRTISGTSMACPHVAGVAALWWQAVSQSGRAATAKNVHARLLTSARLDVFSGGFSEPDFGEGFVTAP